MKRIIYPNSDDGVCVIIPTGELPVEEVARKDVPAGVPYRIIDTADMTSDSTFRDAWEADFSQPDGYGIGAKAWFIEQYRKEIETIEAHEQTDDAAIMHFRADRIAELNRKIADMEAQP